MSGGADPESGAIPTTSEPPPPRRRPTIADVARAASVSPTTVSFVLNDVVGVSISDGTRRRVRHEADRLDYRPNAAARLLRTSRSDTIGFITDEIASTPFAVDIIRGAQDAAWAHGKVLMIVNTEANPNIKERAAALMVERQVEGLIYAAMFHQEVTTPFPTVDLPTVLVDCYAADRSITSVVPDEVGGGREATRVLTTHGHRRIALLNLHRGMPATEGRLHGYHLALAEAGLPLDDALVRFGNNGADSGYHLTRQVMMLPDPPTALFCGNDRTAMGAYDALKELGCRIPNDVSVVGFDNHQLIARYLRPALTTMTLPHYEMGQWAVRHLLVGAAEDGGLGAPVQHQLPCPLVERQSVAPPITDLALGRHRAAPN